MRIDDIQQMFTYSYLATQRVLQTAARLTPAEFSEPPSILGAQSVQYTLVHMLDVEISWRKKLQSRLESSSDLLLPEQFPDVESLRVAWQADQPVMTAWLTSLDEEALYSLLPNGRQMWLYLVHMMNHSTQHRSEVAMILTSFGHSPGDLDFPLILRSAPTAN